MPFFLVLGRSRGSRSRLAVFNLLVALLLLYGINVLASDVPEKIPETEIIGKTLDSVRYLGLEKTVVSTVSDEMRCKDGEEVTKTCLDESIQAFWNLQSFSAISVYGQKSGVHSIRVIYEFVERWSILPITRFSSGGGTVLFTLGVYDFNLFGRAVELGGLYENVSGAHSGSLWLNRPRTLGLPLTTILEAGIRVRNRDLYTNEGDLEGAFTLQRRNLRLLESYQLHKWVALGLGFRIDFDRWDDAKLDDERKTLNLKNGFDSKGTSHEIFVETEIKLGFLDYGPYLIKGHEWRLSSSFANPTWDASHAFNLYQLNGVSFFILPYETNLGIQIKGGVTNSDLPQYRFFIGGLDGVRGFVDGQFDGDHYWQANIEGRISTLKTNWVVLQAATFMDFVKFGYEWNALWPWHSKPESSLGFGLRLVSPKIYRLVIRTDLAFTLTRKNALAFSFGTTQFF